MHRNILIALYIGCLAISFHPMSHAFIARNIIAVGSNVVLSSPDAEIWTPNQVTNTVHLSDVVLANNQYIIAGQCRLNLKSSLGTTWSSYKTPFCFERMIWSHQQYFALFNDADTTSATIYTSKSGAHFKKRFFGLDLAVKGIARGRGRYVGVGYHAVNPDPNDFGLILTSRDGRKWRQLQNTHIPGQLYDIVWGKNQFVAVGTVILTSPDGKTWTHHPLNSAVRLLSVAWNLQHFVAVGFDGVILTSQDGVNWTQQSSGTVRNLNRVVWVNNGNQFVAVGSFGTILTSPNGIDWTPQVSGTTLPLSGVAGPEPRTDPSRTTKREK